MTEHPLGGGNVAAGVVRVGDTVRKPAGFWTPAVDALLAHLRRAGFTGAPRPLGRDDQGRQVLEYVPGPMAMDQPQLDEAGLHRVGRMIRSLHDASADFLPPPGARAARAGQDGSMDALKDRLRGDLTAAMKARDEVRTRTLRMALTSLSREEVAGSSARELSDQEVIGVLTREAKRRREAAEAFAAAGRDEQAAAERAEGAILDTYLPAQLSDEEIAAMAAAVIAETGASGMAAMGQVMKALTPRIAGRADGARVAAEVRHQLAG